METFFSTSTKIQHIIKSFNLTKTLFVSSILIGDAHIGKKSLIRHLFPNTPFISGDQPNEIKVALEEHDEIVIYNFEKISNHNAFNFNNKRIIAIANYMGNKDIIDELFAFIYQMPSLQERPEDVTFLCNNFTKKAYQELMIEPTKINEKNIPLNLSLNSKSLKKSIYYYLMKQTMEIEDIKDMLYKYFYENLEGNDNYRKHLMLYEKPLIYAGLKKYGSQLQLSQALGINRNTLRKKIHEHNID